MCILRGVCSIVTRKFTYSGSGEYIPVEWKLEKYGAEVEVELVEELVVVHQSLKMASPGSQLRHAGVALEVSPKNQ
jgi:hypothetical protein